MKILKNKSIGKLIFIQNLKIKNLMLSIFPNGMGMGCYFSESNRGDAGWLCRMNEVKRFGWNEL